MIGADAEWDDAFNARVLVTALASHPALLRADDLACLRARLAGGSLGRRDRP